MNIKLKSVIHFPDTNSVEATWVDEIAPAYDVPESREPDTKDSDGNIIPGKVTPAHTVPAVEVQVKCHSYADVQMDMLEADLGSDAAAYSDLIATVRAAIPTPTPDQVAAKLADAKANGLRGIDADTDAIYGAVLGHRAEEYNRAAEDAQAYKAAGYTGTVPSSVQSWATAKGWTVTQAADDILATAAQWTAAQAAIRAARLYRKEQVRSAATSADVTAALAAWHSFCAVVRGQLGVA